MQAGHAVLLSSPTAQRQIMVEFHEPLDWLGVDRHASCGSPSFSHTQHIKHLENTGTCGYRVSVSDC